MTEHEESSDDDLEAIDIDDTPDHSSERNRDNMADDETPQPWDSTSDCFDDFDGHAIVEPDDVKARRLRGESDARDQLKAFDSRAVFYSSLFVFEWLVFLLSLPLFLAFCVVVVGPLVFFYKWWKANQKECSFPTVVHALGRGFYDVTLMMVCASYGALIVGLVVLFWLYDAGAFKNSGEGAVVFTFYTFVILPFVASEEALKGMFVRMQHRRVQRSQAAAAATAANGMTPGNSGGRDTAQGGRGGRMVDEMTRQHLIHSTATSVGYALSQAMGWVVIAHMASSGSSETYASSLGDQVALCLVVGVLVTAFGTPLQLLSGYLIGLEVTRDKWTYCGTSLLVPMALRSVYYVSAVGWLLLVPSLAGALCLFMLTNAVVCVLMVWRVKQVERAMPGAYLRRVGYLTWGGYGVLDIADDDGDDGTGIQAGVHDAPPLSRNLANSRPASGGGGGIVGGGEGSRSEASGRSGDGGGGDVEMQTTSSSSDEASRPPSAAQHAGRDASRDGGGEGHGEDTGDDSVGARRTAVSPQALGGRGAAETVKNPLALNPSEEENGMDDNSGGSDEDEIAVI